MITAATVTYSDGSTATFTGEPLDLSTIPTESSSQQDATITVQAQAGADPESTIPGVPDTSVVTSVPATEEIKDIIVEHTDGTSETFNETATTEAAPAE